MKGSSDGFDVFKPRQFKFLVGGNKLMKPSWVNNWATDEQSLTKGKIIMRKYFQLFLK